MSGLDRIEELATSNYLAVYDDKTGLRVFPDALIPLLVAVARAADALLPEPRQLTYTLGGSMIAQLAEEGRDAAGNLPFPLRRIEAALAAVERYADEHLPAKKERNG